ncbi:hypothetical protein HanIR_Chr11g0558831 [Helianthus annuus]|nr:hypothetical protein HanIR_Chr11g0558831 [Helianthus annuus]
MIYRILEKCVGTLVIGVDQNKIDEFRTETITCEVIFEINVSGQGVLYEMLVDDCRECHAKT